MSFMSGWYGNTDQYPVIYALLKTDGDDERGESRLSALLETGLSLTGDGSADALCW